MLFGLPRPLHPPHPIRQRARDPIPREQQILSLSKTNIRIARQRRQRQRLRRLTQRTHQNPRRPAPSSTSSSIAGTGTTGTGTTCAPGTGTTGTTGAPSVGTTGTTGTRTMGPQTMGTASATGGSGAVGARGTGRVVAGVLTTREPTTGAAVGLGTARVLRRLGVGDREVLAGERTFRRPQRGIGGQPIPPLSRAIRTTRVLRIEVEQIHHTLLKKFENLCEFFHSP
ncbi:hypothetical protein AB0B54_36495 [Microbispora bryophytorum]|uniref:hypothetical protein n=1 Tax=Microbispora bryophytorum TaxID=1460882 RepID=UPI0033FE3DB8